MILPNEFEEYIGELWDPTNHGDEIGSANGIIEEFVEAMAAGRIPTSTLESLRGACEILGKYAGYPIDSFHMDEFLTSSAASSYRTTEKVLKSYASDMNELIDARRLHAKKLLEVPAEEPQRNSIDEDDLPF